MRKFLNVRKSISFILSFVLCICMLSTICLAETDENAGVYIGDDIEDQDEEIKVPSIFTEDMTDEEMADAVDGLIESITRPLNAYYYTRNELDAIREAYEYMSDNGRSLITKYAQYLQAAADYQTVLNTEFETDVNHTHGTMGVSFNSDKSSYSSYKESSGTELNPHVINGVVGDNIYITISPYLHVMYEGCGVWYCPMDCGEDDNCFKPGMGCRCDTDTFLRTATVDAHSSDTDVLFVGAIQADDEDIEMTPGVMSDGTLKLTAVSAGTATLTVKAYLYNWIPTTVTYKFIITKNTDKISAESVSLDKNYAELAAGEQLQLSAEISPANVTTDSVKWTSSDESIAVVDQDGNVTAKACGQAVITASAIDGSEKKAACVIRTRYSDVNGSSSSRAEDYQYYYKAVYWASENGITKGYDNIVFCPGRTCTRAEMMIFLWRLAGEPEVSGSMPFTDVTAGKNSDTYKAILWGYSAGIVKGYSGTTEFRPENGITRSDSLIMLYRLAGKPSVSGKLTFSDVTASKKSDTYRSVLWAEQNKITKGYADGTFRPELSCLREHIVTFLYRYAGTEK